MQSYVNPDFRRWLGKWIWAENSPQQNTVVLFRKEFQVSEQGQIRVLVSADTRYRLYVNGTYIGCGPIQSQPYNAYFDCHNVGEYITEGVNCVAAEVYYGGHIKDSRGGLLLEVEDEKGNVLLASDRSFKTLPSRAWTTNTYCQSNINRFAPYQEFFDARLMPEGWKSVGFDHSSWQNATVINGRNQMNVPPTAGPWTKISARPIPFMREYITTPMVVMEEECLFLKNRFRVNDLSISLSQAGRPLSHASVCRGEDTKGSYTDVLCNMDGTYGGVYNPTLLLDFGKVNTAYLELELDGHAGQIIEIGYAERLVDGYFNNAIECQFADQYTLKEGKQTFRSFHWRGYRYVKLVFKECFSSLRIRDIRGIVTEYPFEDKGYYRSDDTRLEDVMNICRHTVKLCCNEAIVDTPWREQSQWMGDVAAVTLGAIYSLFGETKLARKFLTQSAGNQLPTGFITNTTNTTADHYQNCMIDYNFWWVISVWDYYMYTGESEIIDKLYPIICKMMLSAAEFRNRYGMLDRVPYLIFLDWAKNDHRGECCGLNAIYYGALQVLLHMAEYKGDAYMIGHAREAISLIGQHFSERFFNREKQVFVDANVDGFYSDTVSESGNMLSVYFGLASADEAKCAIAHIIVDRDISFVEACPFLGAYTLRALAKAGREDLAIDMILEKWYGRFCEIGLTSTAEEWSINGSYRNGDFLPIMRSLSHAWSAGPAEFLIKELNAIRILEPGCRKIRLSPCVLGCDYELTYPTPMGELRVFQKNNKIGYTAPPGIEVCVAEQSHDTANFFERKPI